VTAVTRRPNRYNNSAWRRFRTAYLAEHPRCVVCGKPATVVDHVIDAVAAGLFPNLPPGTSAFQAMCASDHSKKTARRFA
jgi:5-methylcytosine-specific restriction protein A